jgi:hypothetical protein
MQYLHIFSVSLGHFLVAVGSLWFPLASIRDLTGMAKMLFMARIIPSC